jgi:hypothetical protein
MNYLAVGLALIIIIILYYAYYYVTNNSLTAGLQPLNQPNNVPYYKLTNPGAITYSYQCWLYLSQPSNSPTYIFSRGVDRAKNEFEVDINGQQLRLRGGKGIQAPTQIMVITNNFPLQKWTYLVINVLNLSTFEAYVNGKLVKTVNVSSSAEYTPDSKQSNLVIGNVALSGYTTQFTRTTTAMDAKTVWTTYLSGNGLSNFFSNLIPYGLTMSVANGEDVQRVIKMF